MGDYQLCMAYAPWGTDWCARPAHHDGDCSWVCACGHAGKHEAGTCWHGNKGHPIETPEPLSEADLSRLYERGSPSLSDLRRLIAEVRAGRARCPHACIKNMGHEPPCIFGEPGPRRNERHHHAGPTDMFVPTTTHTIDCSH